MVAANVPSVLVRSLVEGHCDVLPKLFPLFVEKAECGEARLVTGLAFTSAAAAGTYIHIIHFIWWKLTFHNNKQYI